LPVSCEQGHHNAFNLSNDVFRQTVERLDERGIEHGFMDSIYLHERSQRSLSNDRTPADP
jgi:hypothetical protein